MKRRAGVLDRMDGADVGVIEGAAARASRWKRSSAGRSRVILRQQELEGDAAPELGVVRLVGDPHAATADGADDPVMKDGRPRRQRHAGVIIVAYPGTPGVRNH